MIISKCVPKNSMPTGVAPQGRGGESRVTLVGTKGLDRLESYEQKDDMREEECHRPIVDLTHMFFTV